MRCIAPRVRCTSHDLWLIDMCMCGYAPLAMRSVYDARIFDETPTQLQWRSPVLWKRCVSLECYGKGLYILIHNPNHKYISNVTTECILLHIRYTRWWHSHIFVRYGDTTRPHIECSHACQICYNCRVKILCLLPRRVPLCKHTVEHITIMLQHRRGVWPLMLQLWPKPFVACMPCIIVIHHRWARVRNVTTNHADCNIR
jgi:hypothetical protein